MFLMFTGHAIERFVIKEKGIWNCYVSQTRLPQPPSPTLPDLLKWTAQAKLCSQNSDMADVVTQKLQSDTCAIIISPTSKSPRCDSCNVYRGALRKAASRARNMRPSKERVTHDSRTPFTVLSEEEKLQRLRNLRGELNKQQNMIRESIEKKSVECCDKTHKICVETVTEKVKNMPENSPQKLFLEEQIKAISVKGASGRRWHPSIIRWCLLLHKKSKSAYRYVGESGMMVLPSERTLTDYRSYKPIVSGVDVDQILSLSKTHKGEDVGVLIDEMKISEGLVYNASTGNLCGFIDSLDEDSVLEFDENLDQPTNFASHALCFMIRGLKSNLQAVVATYATKSLSATQLYSRFWDLAAHLELVGLKVRCVVSDGASTNRRFYNLHAGDYQDPVTFRMKNKFTAEDRPIYLVSDTCHLMKTTRNCMENSGGNRNSRKLVVSTNLGLLLLLLSIFELERF